MECYCITCYLGEQTCELLLIISDLQLFLFVKNSKTEKNETNKKKNESHGTFYGNRRHHGGAKGNKRPKFKI